jgi:phosphoribosyl 1,2-cyclic phosphodiesterase
MIGYCPLASGSKGNCIYLATHNTRILIDAGISGRATQKRLEELGVKVEDIDAIFITHEHSDHITGLKVLAMKKQIPVFANADTARAICEKLGGEPKFKIFSTGESFEFGDLEVHPFAIQHDAVDPVGFTIHTPEHKLGFCTDLGFATSLVKSHLKGCHYLYVEANHDPALVLTSKRPALYKQRTLGKTGHLSNESCAQLLVEVAHPKLKHVHLAHLSQECNKEELAKSIISEKLQQQGFDIPVDIALQSELSKKIHFSEETATTSHPQPSAS